ncbi:hypothetical protein AB1Y20_008387 [Prymnesium parvum]|uniref:Sugar phosphate transporter domain-containing protein n=1 Tax=Prymnesium parvum TaxID=97485 RepID=A0AB34ISY7_PRYPA|mmetsp:Transcript_42256/g.105245  ORF Transcript_42256/g.105245 Transcript_42256/m.105245 type:complete len:380 (-) Transcript_42256:182-1321(-)
MRLYYEKLPSDTEQEAQPLKPLTISKTASPCLRLADEHMPHDDTAWRRAQMLGACAAYALVGPSLVMVNNHILKQLRFPYPLILSSIGLLTTALCCSLALRVGGYLAARHEAPSGVQPETPSSEACEPRRVENQRVGSRAWLPEVSLEFWLRNMVPIGAAQGLTFFGTNAAYMYLTITFTQMLAAFTPTVTLVLLYATGVEIPTTRSSVAVVLISVGCLISSYGEGHFNLVGVGYRSLGIFSEAVRLVLTQKLLKNYKLNVIESQYFLAPIGAGFLILGACFSEVPRFWRANAMLTMRQNPLLFCCSALLGVVASMLTFVVIKLTNSVTLKVMNTARNAAFVLFTVFFLHEQASNTQLLGYMLSLCAFSLYLYFKRTGS